jgi:hypothetical protein
MTHPSLIQKYIKRKQIVLEGSKILCSIAKTNSAFCLMANLIRTFKEKTVKIVTSKSKIPTTKETFLLTILPQALKLQTR